MHDSPVRTAACQVNATIVVALSHSQGIVATVAPTVHKDDVITVVKEDGTLDALLSQL